MLTQLLKALRLSGEQRHLVLTHFETSCVDKNSLNLQRITVKLFGAYNFGTRATFHVGDGVSDADSDIQEEEDILFAGNGKGKKRLGLDEAVKIMTSVLGMDNGRSKSETSVFPSFWVKVKEGRFEDHPRGHFRKRICVSDAEVMTAPGDIALILSEGDYYYLAILLGQKRL